MLASLLLSILALAAPAPHAGGAPARAARAGAHVAAPVVPFIADDYPRAVALAKQRHLPVFIEGWAPW